MSDEADITEERMEVQMASAIAAIQSRQPEAEATGYCLNCGEEAKPGQRWCDVSCRNDWQARVK